jgi:AcrR family transcriptional regulator
MPRKVDHKLRREAFLAAAYRTIKKKGLEGVTFRAVAREAGFTTGALARYVRDDMEAMEALPDRLESLRQVIYLSLPLDEERRGNWNFWMGFWERSVRNATVRKLTHTRYG